MATAVSPDRSGVIDRALPEEVVSLGGVFTSCTMLPGAAYGTLLCTRPA